MFKYITFNIIGMIIFIFTMFSYSNVYVNEEVIPIREKDIITSIDYNITLDKKTNRKSFDINTSILSSIYHYKDINNIDLFTVHLNLINKSKYKYKIDSILLVSNNYIIREINYKIKDNTIIFELNKDDFDSKYFIKLKVKR